MGRTKGATGMIGGRNGWVAWPVGLACVGIVAGLVWLARPAVPAVIGFIGDTLRAGMAAHTDAPFGYGPSATATPGASGPVMPDGLTQDCRSLYPAGLWAALTGRRDTVLGQSQALPATAAAVRDALAPQVVMTCVWRDASGGTVTTTLSRVSADAATIAQADLVGDGFTCTTSGDGIRCVRAAASGSTEPGSAETPSPDAPSPETPTPIAPTPIAPTPGATAEDDVIRGGLWLSTTEDGWHPDGYTNQLVGRLWP